MPVYTSREMEVPVAAARVETNVARWILVAGTGKIDLPPEVNWTARAVGAATARAGYGLVGYKDLPEIEWAFEAALYEKTLKE